MGTATDTRARGTVVPATRKLASGRSCRLVATSRRRRSRLRTSTGLLCGRHRGRASDATVARYYDPATAQFLTRDPLEATTGSPYGYVDGDPLDGSDPTGLWCLLGHSGSGCRGGGTYNWSVQHLDPAYLAVEGYANEWQAAESGCSLWTVAAYGAEGVAGVALTGLAAVGGAAAATGQSLGDVAFGSKLVGPDSRLFGNSSLGQTNRSGLLNQKGSSWHLGWSVDGQVSPTVPGFRLDTPFIDHAWWFHASGF